MRAHYCTAEEQLLIVRGEASPGIEGTPDTLLGAGGLAMVASKPVHRFTCTAKEECLMFVTFDRAYGQGLGQRREIAENGRRKKARRGLL